MNCPVCNENLPEGSICCPLCGEHIASKLQQNKVKEARVDISNRIEEAFASPVFKILLIVLHLIGAVSLAQLAMGALAIIQNKQGVAAYAVSALPALVFLISSIVTSIFGWRLTRLKKSKNTDLIGTQRVFNNSARAVFIIVMIVGIAAISALVVACLVFSVGYQTEWLKDGVFPLIGSVIGTDLVSILSEGEDRTVTIIILLIVLVASLVVWIVGCCLFVGAYKRANEYYGKVTAAYWNAEYSEKKVTVGVRLIVVGVLEMICGVLPMIPLLTGSDGQTVFLSVPVADYLPAAVLMTGAQVLLGLHLILTAVVFFRIHRSEIAAIAVYEKELAAYDEMETKTRLELAEYDRRKRKAEHEAEEKKRRELEEKETRIRLNNEQQQQMMQALLLQMMQDRMGADAVRQFLGEKDPQSGEGKDADGSADQGDVPAGVSAQAPEDPEAPTGDGAQDPLNTGDGKEENTFPPKDETSEVGEPLSDAPQSPDREEA